MVSKETASGSGVTYKNNGYIFTTDLSWRLWSNLKSENDDIFILDFSDERKVSHLRPGNQGIPI